MLTFDMLGVRAPSIPNMSKAIEVPGQWAAELAWSVPIPLAYIPAITKKFKSGSASCACACACARARMQLACQFEGFLLRPVRHGATP